jgi:hypothetical protein
MADEECRAIGKGNGSANWPGLEGAQTLWEEVWACSLTLKMEAKCLCETSLHVTHLRTHAVLKTILRRREAMEELRGKREEFLKEEFSDLCTSPSGTKRDG